MRLAAAVAAGAVALLVALALVLGDSKPRQAGSNYVAELEPVGTIQGSGERCQSGLVLPADTDAVRLLLGTYGEPTPRVSVRATKGSEEVTSGSIPAGGHEGHLDVPLRRVDAETGGVTVCVDIEGSERTVLYGLAGTVRLEWLRPGSESWFDLLPVVARRFGYGKANPFGSWLIVVAGLMLALAWFLAGRVLLRELRA
jgi:hypothetical protein